ncbi:MAG: hypothetical protein CL927_05225 [Deltaproteobacteria bacterium]|nr:hypothetical protein [Deltaproteobacteria bacterium]HCH64931.1 hypothetical protein [Deltaproteobacteria bacterium]
MPRIRIFHGEVLLLEHRLRPGRTTIGRADQCDIALPGTTISRLHCTFRGNDRGWRVDDHSRHGTWVNSERVDGHASLSDGASVRIGEFTATLVLQAAKARPTAPRPTDQSHEQVVGTVADGLRVERAALSIVDGPGKNSRFVLRSPRVGLGGEGSQIVLPDTRLTRDHVYLRVSRGRVMVEPGRGAAYLDGERVRAITPLYAEEELLLGETVLRTERFVDEEPVISTHFGEMVAHSASMKSLFGKLRRMAAHHFTLLVIGESGTGKELIARGIHEHSPRADGPFVALNCGAIRPELFESALFGHEKGAFTGAEERRDGAFLQADGGTLFLDEIGELPETCQASLLRVLETGEVRRVGGSQVSFPDVRIVAATNRDLSTDARTGNFRSDLYFRLAVLAVDVPPLRKRIADIPVLTRYLLRHLNGEAYATDDALELLKRHDWPGNVRELRNVLTRAFVMNGARIDPAALSFHNIKTRPVSIDPSGKPAAERAFLIDAMARHDGNRTRIAREMGIARSTLNYRLRKYELI